MENIYTAYSDVSLKFEIFMFSKVCFEMLIPVHVCLEHHLVIYRNNFSFNFLNLQSASANRFEKKCYFKETQAFKY